jgi:hypothetical protein
LPLKLIITTVFDDSGRDLKNLCFGAVFYIIRRALAIYRKKRLRNRRRRQLYSYRLRTQSLSLYTELNRSLRVGCDECE